MDTGASLLASRHKRNLLALMLEKLPTLSKMQLHKPHVYDKDWICYRCDLDSEDFNHLWLCSESLIDLQNIIPQQGWQLDVLDNWTNWILDLLDLYQLVQIINWTIGLYPIPTE